MTSQAVNPCTQFETTWRHWFGDHPKSLLETEFNYSPAPEPRLTAKSQSKLIADAVEIEAAPIEEFLYNLYTPTGPINCGDIISWIDTLGVLPGYPGLHSDNFDPNVFSAWVVDAAVRGRTARDRGVPPMPIFAFMKSASAFITMTMAHLTDVPSGVVALGHCIGLRPWVSFSGRFPIAFTDPFVHSEKNFRLLVETGITNVVLHVRDPRQVVLSIAHYDDPARPTRLIDNYIEVVIPLYRDWLMCWLTRASRSGIRVLLTTYESFVENEADFFHSILEYFNAGRFLHDRVSESVRTIKELAEQGHANFRNGTIDEWKDVLSASQIRNINKNCSGTFATLYGF